jgi:enoyl-CoA hydratase/carnithine racemase
VLSQGDTLGGGLESIMPFHKIIFERSAQAGFPEVLFNLFPGMGAWDFTIRKAGFAVANEMILSGRLYSAEELLYRRMVDLVVDDGEGEAAIERVLREVDPRHRGTLAALRARRLVAPITLEQLTAVVDQWAESALGLTDRDLRLMERLARAQARKAGGADEGAVEEIKRMELETAWGERRTGADRRAQSMADRRVRARAAAHPAARRASSSAIARAGSPASARAMAWPRRGAATGSSRSGYSQQPTMAGQSVWAKRAVLACSAAMPACRGQRDSTCARCAACRCARPMRTRPAAQMTVP